MTRRNESCAFFSGVRGGRGGRNNYVGGCGGEPSKNAKFLKAIIFFIYNFEPANLQVGESPDPRTLVETFKIIKMKELILKNGNDGRNTVKPKRRLIMTPIFVEGVKVEDEDLSQDFPVAKKAEREMETLRKKVSPGLFDLLTLQLMGFRGDMQYVMAENLVIFACDHTAYTTGCPSVDTVLDICYKWIAEEQGIIVEKFKNLI